MNCPPTGYFAPQGQQFYLPAACGSGVRPAVEHYGAQATAAGTFAALAGLGCGPSGTCRPCNGFSGMGGMGATSSLGSPIYALAAQVRPFAPTAASSAETAASALASAVAQAARANKAGADSDYGAALAAAKQIPGDAPGAGDRGGMVLQLYSVVMAEAARTSELMAKHLARTPEDQQRYAEGTAAAERAHVTYRGYSDVRRPIEDDIAEAAANSAADAGRAIGGAAQSLREGAAWISANPGKVALGAGALLAGYLWLTRRR